MPISHGPTGAYGPRGAARGDSERGGGPGDGPDGEGVDLSTFWLRAFLEVARQGSFTVAARRLALTQSAVSRQIASLEAALGGAPLFDRLPRGVRLTAHGRTLLPHAEAVTG
ncbi:LysR family transcriptional regulator [Streptomyces sp. CC224B]|uniref:LysR family transcriptional regulator n=1 Tax=Streptomyces sp. CC224B TaxID=3044571 RepID=UPI0024A99D44|nr:LysR family transcriptional regulator [Streptomyces sp. CC224B]